MIPQISWHTLFWSMAQKPNFVLSIKSCFVMFSSVFCSEQGCPIVLSHPFHNLHNGSWLCPHCFARKDIRILWDGNLRIRDLPIPWAQIAARAPLFFLVDLEGQSTTAFGNKVVRTLASLSPSKGEDRLGVLRKLAKFAAMVHNVAPPVLLLWKRPCRDETADKPRTLRKHFALGRTCSFQTDSDNVIKFMSLHICDFSLWQGVAGGMQGGAGDRQGNAWKPSTRPLSTRTCQKKMRRTCTSRWTHQSFMILLSKYIKIRGADFCSDLGLHPGSTSCNMGPCFWRCGSFQKNENNTNSCPSEQCSPDGPLLRPPLSRTLLVSLAEALHRGGSPQFSSKLFVSPETWSQATSWMHMMTYLHTTQNTHTITHTWHNYLWPQYTPIRSAGKSIAQWRCSTPGRSKKEASEWRQDVLRCFKMCQDVSRRFSYVRWPCHMTSPLSFMWSNEIKRFHAMPLGSLSRFLGVCEYGIYIYIYWIILIYLSIRTFFHIYIYIFKEKNVTRKVGSTPPRPPPLRG